MKILSIRWVALCAAILSFTLPMQAVRAQNEAQAVSAEEKAYQARMLELARSLKPQTGDIHLSTARATLRLGKDYYFIDAEGSRKIIVEAWGNPAEQAEGVLGMVFPQGKSFADTDSWGAVVTYEAEGHVSDEDAASTDFDALLDQMREGEAENNAARKEQGYPPVHLVGWADRPTYDGKRHSVVWARDIQFGGEGDHSLNYDVRLLGRNGVLSLNMISSMSHLADVKAAGRAFAATVTYDAGFAYGDYVEGVDKAAGYGIAGLIAAGAGVAAVKKLGLLAVVLAFGKKFIVFLVIGLAAAWKWIMRLFRRKAEEEEAVAYAPEPEPVPDAALAPEAGPAVAPGEAETASDR